MVWMHFLLFLLPRWELVKVCGLKEERVVCSLLCLHRYSDTLFLLCLSIQAVLIDRHIQEIVDRIKWRCPRKKRHKQF